MAEACALSPASRRSTPRVSQTAACQAPDGHKPDRRSASSSRRLASVGMPLAGVQARLTDDAGRPVADGVAGQIEIRGPQVFCEYWRRPEETARAFRGGWFLTGDEGIVESGYWRILGRRSTDIIKSAGFKISALEIEECLREHASVQDCAVVGVPDDDLGERISAAVVARAAVDAASLREWLRTRLAPYKVPRQFLLVPELPRNAMGKVVKPDVAALFATDEPARRRPGQPGVA